MVEGPDAHDHAPVALVRARTAPEALKALDAAHPVLAEILSLAARYPDLTDEEKEDLARLGDRMAAEGPWLPGFHAEGDRCSVCGEPTEPIFEDALEGDATLPYAAFASDLPTHVACMPRFAEKYPRLAPRVLDQARRATMRDLDRPSASMAAFFRHDLLAHGAFDLEDWANSVHEANAGTMSRQGMKDVQKLIQWVHDRVFHGHAH